jgi:hypothetical protein
VKGTKMTDAEILQIRDRHMPSQGEPFDMLAFGRAVAAMERALCIEAVRAAGPKDGPMALVTEVFVDAILLGPHIGYCHGLEDTTAL